MIVPLNLWASEMFYIYTYLKWIMLFLPKRPFEKEKKEKRNWGHDPIKTAHAEIQSFLAGTPALKWNQWHPRESFLSAERFSRLSWKQHALFLNTWWSLWPDIGNKSTLWIAWNASLLHFNCFLMDSEESLLLL